MRGKDSRKLSAPWGALLLGLTGLALIIYNLTVRKEASLVWLSLFPFSVATAFRVFDAFTSIRAEFRKSTFSDGFKKYPFTMLILTVAFLLWLVIQTLAVLAVSVWSDTLRLPPVTILGVVLSFAFVAIPVVFSVLALRFSRARDKNTANGQND